MKILIALPSINVPQPLSFTCASTDSFQGPPAWLSTRGHTGVYGGEVASQRVLQVLSVLGRIWQDHFA